jgi:glutaredoxin 3
MSQVTVFSTTTCKYCKQVKDHLADKGIEYEEVLLDLQPERLQESIAISGTRSVPVTKIVAADGKAYGVIGVDIEAIDKVLALQPAA